MDTSKPVTVSADQLQAMMEQIKTLQAQVNTRPVKAEKPADPNIIGCATIREPNDQYGASIKYQPSFTTFPHAGVQKAVKFWRDLLDHVDDLRAAVERAEKQYPESPKPTEDKPTTNGRRVKAGTTHHPSTVHGGTIVI